MRGTENVVAVTLATWMHWTYPLLDVIGDDGFME